MSKLKQFVAISALAMLTACGGGGSGGSGGGGGGSSNRAPSFTTAAALTTVEQRSGQTPALIAQLQATDPDGDALTFTINTGKDGALFQFLGGTAGALAFRTAPSFETPQDANRDNVYEVDVTVSDGRLSAVQTFLVTLQNSNEGISVTRVATGFAPGSRLAYDRFADALFVVSPTGAVSRVDPATGNVTALPAINLPTLGGQPSQVIDVVTSEIALGGLSVLVRGGPAPGSTLGLVLARRSDPSSSFFLWSQNFPGVTAAVDASLWVGGGAPYVAFSDGGLRDAAQDPANLLGNVAEFRYLGDINGNLVGADLQIRAWGLRSPILVAAPDRQIALDRGLNFSEINGGGFGVQNTNYEWPIRDGLTNVGFTGTVQGNREAPLAVSDNAASGRGRWLDGAAVLVGTGWQTIAVISDEAGNILSYDYSAANNPIERRNLDFTPNTGTITRITAMDGGQAQVGSAMRRLFLIDEDGELYMALLSG